MKIRMLEESQVEITGRIEKAAEEMHRKGWFFLEAKCDALMENLTLLFERDVDIE